jgi:hypothetical protein
MTIGGNDGILLLKEINAPAVILGPLNIICQEVNKIYEVEIYPTYLCASLLTLLLLQVMFVCFFSFLILNTVLLYRLHADNWYLFYVSINAIVVNVQELKFGRLFISSCVTIQKLIGLFHIVFRCFKFHYLVFGRENFSKCTKKYVLNAYVGWNRRNIRKYHSVSFGDVGILCYCYLISLWKTSQNLFLFLWIFCLVVSPSILVTFCLFNVLRVH